MSRPPDARRRAALWSELYSEGDNAALWQKTGALMSRVMRRELTERQREAFRLHVGEGLSQKEIADLWGVHPSVVCRHIARARDVVRHYMEYLV